MLNALTLSTSSILSSGATTVIGFLALCLMRFQIGPDLGLALAKGILISLITVFVLMPIIILYTYKLIDKTMHKPLLPSFRRFGKFILRVMIPIVCIFVIAIVPSYIASNSNSFYYGASHIFNEKTQLGKDIKEINTVFGKNDTYVLMVPKDDLAKQKELSKELKDIENVDKITSYVDSVGAEIPKEYIDEATLKKLDSDEHTRMVIAVKADYEGDETFALVENIRETAQKYYGDKYYLAGEGVSTYDLMDTVTKDMLKVNLIAIGAVLLVLLITMRKALLPAILVLAIETAIWINLSLPFVTGKTIFYIAYLIISSVQLGATVDYAILFSTRYREERTMLDKKEAIVETISKTTASILTSGSVLTVIGFLLGKISSHGLLSQLGYLLGAGTLCSLAIVLFVLPGLLYILDRWVIDKKLTGGNR